MWRILSDSVAKRPDRIRARSPPPTFFKGLWNGEDSTSCLTFKVFFELNREMEYELRARGIRYEKKLP